jgi:hypothetical protein
MTNEGDAAQAPNAERSPPQAVKRHPWASLTLGVLVATPLWDGHRHAYRLRHACQPSL